jgi:signal transduction histidine kinase
MASAPPGIAWTAAKAALGSPSGSALRNTGCRQYRVGSARPPSPMASTISSSASFLRARRSERSRDGYSEGNLLSQAFSIEALISGNAETFRRLLDPKLPRALEAIQTAAKRGESLTRQLLTFSRSQHLSPRVLDLTASIRNMRTLIESSLRGNIVYNEKIDPDIWHRSDHQKASQVFSAQAPAHKLRASRQRP